MTDRELMQTAFDNLVGICEKGSETIEALRARLAQPEQEPVAWRCNYCRDTGFGIWGDVCQRKENHTAPPQREWQGLTDEEIKEQSDLLEKEWISYEGFARAIEAKLKEKNA